MDLIDVHTHAIAPDLAAPAGDHDWVTVLRESATSAAIHVVFSR